MIHAKIEKVGGRHMIPLEDADLAALGVAEGATVAVDIVREDAVGRGKAFVERYITTFEALAK